MNEMNNWPAMELPAARHCATSKQASIVFFLSRDAS